jgi:diguanylate cyclase (GGDEF)-like protein
VLLDAGADDAAQVAEDLRRRVEAHSFEFEDRSWPLTVSVGIAVAEGPEPGTPEDLIRLADAKLHEAKRAGGNRVDR